MRLIDADALKKAFEETVCIEPMPYAFVKQIIDNAPTVEPEPYFEKAEKDKRIYERGFEDGQNARPQGEWIYHKSDGYFLPYMECSNCKVQDLLENLTKKEYREVNHFCFNCGADMRPEK